MTEIYGFNTPSSPAAGLVQTGDGSLYGTTLGGGAYGLGTVFKLATNGDLTFLHSFDGTNGAGPQAVLIVGLDGALFGTTSGRVGSMFEYPPTFGATVFRITTNGAFTTLASINPTNGVIPSGLVQTADGTLYGTIQGTSGAVFSITGGSNFNFVFFFNPNHAYEASNGYGPTGGLTLGKDGNLYGMTDYGGEFNVGTVFKMTSGGVVTTVANFDGTNGSAPSGKLTKAPDGSFYGLTMGDESSNFGGIFHLAVDGAISNFYEFAPTMIVEPQETLALDSAGNLYGTTLIGSNVVYEVTTNGTFSLLASFNFANGGAPNGDLFRGADGNFYGTTSSGGSAGAGTAFRLTPDGQLNTLFSFPHNGGNEPNALFLGGDGNLYGTTVNGGVGGGLGTVFRVTPGGDFTQLVAFDGTNGANPTGPLVEDGKGGLYGFQYGGAGNGATGFVQPDDSLLNAPGIFSFSCAGVLTNYEFNPGDSLLHPALLCGLDGVLYGTGDTNFAKIFSLQPGERLGVVVPNTDTNLDWPTSLVQAGDGTLFGVASASNNSVNSSIFKATTDGFAATLVSFPSNIIPLWISPGLDGNLYGMTMLATNAGGGGGGGGRGAQVEVPLGYTFFRMTPEGALDDLTTLNDNSNDFSIASFVMASDGSFYSLAYGGSLFEFTTNGEVVPIYAPVGGNFSTLSLQAADGDFYGAVPIGGTRGSGYVFRLTLRPTVQTAIATKGTLNFTWDAIPSRQYQLQSSASLSSPVWNNVGDPVSTTNYTVSTSDTPGSSTRYYRVVQLP